MYAGHDAAVTATARGDAPALTAAIKGGTIMELDVRNQSHVKAIAERLDASHAAIDILIHNAGVKVGAEADVMDINGEAPYRLIGAILPAILRSERKQIVVITSDRGQSRFQGEVKRNRCSGDPGCLYTKSKMLANERFRELEPREAAGHHCDRGSPRMDKDGYEPHRQAKRGVQRKLDQDHLREAPAGVFGRFYNFDGKVLKW